MPVIIDSFEVSEPQPTARPSQPGKPDTGQGKQNLQIKPHELEDLMRRQLERRIRLMAF